MAGSPETDVEASDRLGPSAIKMGREHPAWRRPHATFPTILCAFVASNAGAVADSRYGLECDLVAQGTGQHNHVSILVDEASGTSLVDGRFIFNTTRAEPNIRLMTPASEAESLLPTNCGGALCSGETILIDRYSGQIHWTSTSSENARGTCTLAGPGI